jgi:hypothetical protein
MNRFYIFVLSLLALSEFAHAQTFTIGKYTDTRQRGQAGASQRQSRNELAMFAQIPADDQARVTRFSEQFHFDGRQCLFGEEQIRSEFRVYLMRQYVANPPLF